MRMSSRSPVRRHGLSPDVTDNNGGMYADDAWWNALDPQLQEQIDKLLRTGRLIAAVVLLRREGGLQSPPGLYQAQDLLIERRGELRRRGLVELEPPPPTTEELIGKAEVVTAPVAAIEALWDGDTQGWYVYLIAIVRRPSRHHDRFDEVPLTVLRRSGDIRLINGQVPPWPEAQQAIEKGQAVAQHFCVPFHFISPEAPDTDPPRWWSTRTI
ncbi:hypothetical protein GA0070617_1524 [Micromonospora yangpuensis]|uniref:Uncharacterized protein n=1 Tax=Micromonospora yangpuensis TaxID=683228 RepID=A0A1C6U913_9ACTN|nr:hypothetical protein GA0070617_1524 [Micromonospora yangpuensis]